MPYEIEYRPLQQYIPSRRAFLGASAAAALGFFLSPRVRSERVHAKSVQPNEVSIVEFTPTGRRGSIVTVPTIAKPDSEWRSQLEPEAFRVTRQQGSERARSGKYWSNEERGVYSCVCCGTTNFSSEAKFESRTGWPSFWKPIARENVRETTDDSLGMERIAVSCPRCEAHLGHVFEDGPQPTGRRYRIDSAALRFTKIA